MKWDNYLGCFSAKWRKLNEVVFPLIANLLSNFATITTEREPVKRNFFWQSLLFFVIFWVCFISAGYGTGIDSFVVPSLTWTPSCMQALKIQIKRLRGGESNIPCSFLKQQDLEDRRRHRSGAPACVCVWKRCWKTIRNQSLWRK